MTILKPILIFKILCRDKQPSMVAYHDNLLCPKTLRVFLNFKCIMYAWAWSQWCCSEWQWLWRADSSRIIPYDLVTELRADSSRIIPYDLVTELRADSSRISPYDLVAELRADSSRISRYDIVTELHADSSRINPYDLVTELHADSSRINPYDLVTELRADSSRINPYDLVTELRAYSSRINPYDLLTELHTNLCPTASLSSLESAATYRFSVTSKLQWFICDWKWYNWIYFVITMQDKPFLNTFDRKLFYSESTERGFYNHFYCRNSIFFNLVILLFLI